MHAVASTQAHYSDPLPNRLWQVVLEAITPQCRVWRAPLHCTSCKSVCAAWHWHCCLPKATPQLPPKSPSCVRGQTSSISIGRASSPPLSRCSGHSIWAVARQLLVLLGEIEAIAAFGALRVISRVIQLPWESAITQQATQETWAHMRQQCKGPGSGGKPHTRSPWLLHTLPPLPGTEPLGDSPLGKLHILHIPRHCQGNTNPGPHIAHAG